LFQVQNCKYLHEGDNNDDDDDDDDDDNEDNLSSVVTMLEPTFQLTMGFHGGNPLPFETYDITCNITFVLLNHL